MAEIFFEDTIKANSFEDALRQMERLYPNALDVDLIQRQTADGRESASGKYFVFEVTMEPEDEIDLAPEDLGEEEY